eukprot:356925-Chlamydomonas_euryale.AAC.8
MEDDLDAVISNASVELGPGCIKRYMHTLLSALSQLHAAGMLHRDVKPNNILIGANGEPKLADFGLARAAGSPGARWVPLCLSDLVCPERHDGAGRWGWCGRTLPGGRGGGGSASHPDSHTSTLLDGSGWATPSRPTAWWAEAIPLHTPAPTLLDSSGWAAPLRARSLPRFNRRFDEHFDQDSTIRAPVGQQIDQQWHPQTNQPAHTATNQPTPTPETYQTACTHKAASQKAPSPPEDTTEIDNHKAARMPSVAPVSIRAG